MAGYGQPPGSFGQPQGYGAFPGAPSYMGAPPGAGGAPGMSPPPGMNMAQSPAPGRPTGVPSQYQAPPNLPNINFNAPVIRMGMSQGKPSTPYGYDDRRGGGDSGGGNRGRSGLGADSGRQPRGEVLQPPTKEEVARTIFIGGLVDGVPDDATLEEIFGIGRGLRRWSRVTDADGKSCDFGFAEYDDASSLEIATKLFEDTELPLREKGVVAKNEDGEVKKAKITIMVDPESINYIKQWTKTDENDFQFKLDNAREDLSQLLNTIASSANNGATADADGDAQMENGGTGEDAEVVNITLTAEDELSEVPPEMREQVASEIKAFRERSTRRDLERLRKEEDNEKAERERHERASRPSRLASPPAAAPTGPGGVNGVPVGPRDRAIPGAPSGPKGYRGAQMPKDYVDGVAFVNGGAEEDEEDSASDEELEKKRQDKRKSELEKRYLEQEKRWLQKEKAHFSAVERQQKEEDAAAASKQHRRDELAERLKNFDDEVEKRKPTTLYYKDHRTWVRERRAIRGEEKRRDDHDKRDEQRERDVEQRKVDAARGMADDFLAQQAEEISARSVRNKPEKQAFSLNFGGLGGAKRGEDMEETKPKLQSLGDIGGLLDDEDESTAAGADRKPLKPIEFKPLALGEKMTDEERGQATKQLAASIPASRDELFAWPVKWDHLRDEHITGQLRPYVQKKIMDAIGMGDDTLEKLVEKSIRRRCAAEELITELEALLDEEAEDLVRKVWRMIVFFTEVDARGLQV